jgi:hypothetical protein
VDNRAPGNAFFILITVLKIYGADPFTQHDAVARVHPPIPPAFLQKMTHDILRKAILNIEVLEIIRWIELLRGSRMGCNKLQQVHCDIIISIPIKAISVLNVGNFGMRFLVLFLRTCNQEIVGQDYF